ncbi:uncharacterized protein LOC111332229 [Stylophora pistillata]|uniref:uncharacterized protein LOC111332229 n=1 Tax=Stylophora pistillata TaxID=50429 RepID=UPI000C053AC2|nr:uncharacterized protein LOC111332229 [Stylophora pistillata]
MDEISRLAQQNSLSAETSPTGFWSKNYAALAVYRKEDWVVSVKGFNRFVWDFEGPVLEKENLFGIYQSHGAILIANSEASLQTHDVDNGWDWTRHPGVTTIKLDLDYLKSDAHRYFQPRRLAGSVKLVGSGGNPVAVGAWGMDFSQPQYKFPKGSFQSDINFSFKKSVFFFDSYVICLGSNIRAENSCPYITQTALFQDKRRPVGASSIVIDKVSHKLDVDLTKEPSDFNGVNVDATLVDVNGNGYYIPYPASQGLNVQISPQTSKDSSGKKTSARYATAWLDHGVDPNGKGYEYTIAVAGKNGKNSLKQLASNQRSGSSLKYKVLQKDDNAHIVQMNIQPVKRYGYVIFANSVGKFPGPIQRIWGAHLIIMAETRIGSGDLHIAVSSPDLNFNMSSSRTNRPLNKSSDLTGDEIFFLNSVPVNVQVNLRRAVHFDPNSVMVTVNGDVIGQADTYVELVQKAPNLCKFSSPCAKQIKFKNLVKGFTTEVHLTQVHPTNS